VAASLIARLNHPLSVGWSPRHDLTIPFDGTKHFSDEVFDVPRLLGARCKPEVLAHPPLLPGSAVRAARRLHALLPRSMAVLLVHAETHPAKTWPAARFVAVLDAFLHRHPDFVAFVVGQTRFTLDAGVYRERVIPCHGLSLASSLALVSLADLFLGVDSSMLHAADYFGVPGVGLFSHSENSRRWGFRFGYHIDVCGSGGMRSISVRKVLDALESASRCTKTASRRRTVSRNLAWPASDSLPLRRRRV
jgi:ADP-heptose:LPS heptosyltransferase